MSITNPDKRPTPVCYRLVLMILMVTGSTGTMSSSANAQVNELRSPTNNSHAVTTSSQPVANGSSLQDGTLPQPAAASSALTPLQPKTDNATPVSEPGKLWGEGRPGSLSGKSGAIELKNVISQLASSTVIVIVFCVCGLVLFRKFSGGRRMALQGSRSENEVQATLETSIRLGGNRRLEVVQIGKTRLVVGSDSSGIKSVVPIGAIFQAHLNECMERTDSVEAGNEQQTTRTRSLSDPGIPMEPRDLPRFSSFANRPGR